MSKLLRVCSSCKHYPEDEYCNECIYKITTHDNTGGEPSEEFINKPCVSEQACHEDKMKVLEKIRTEIKSMFPTPGIWMYDEGYGHEHAVCEVLVDVLQIIDKYMNESEDAE